MTSEELWGTLPDSSLPVFLADGKFGMLLTYPTPACEECFIQVPGEEESREVHFKNLNSSTAHALWETGAQVDKAYYLPPDQTPLLMQLLRIDWMNRGGVTAMMES